MSDAGRFPPRDSDCLSPEAAADEAVVVLATLRRLWRHVTSPVLRSCLEAAHTDIAWLTSPGREIPTDDGLDEE